MKTSRRLTMCSKSGRDSRKEPFRQLPSMPTLRLQGRWLDEAGFAIGMRVGVQVMPGRLLLETLGPKYASRRMVMGSNDNPGPGGIFLREFQPDACVGAGNQDGRRTGGPRMRQERRTCQGRRDPFEERHCVVSVTCPHRIIPDSCKPTIAHRGWGLISDMRPELFGHENRSSCWSPGQARRCRSTIPTRPAGTDVETGSSGGEGSR